MALPNNNEGIRQTRRNRKPQAILAIGVALFSGCSASSTRPASLQFSNEPQNVCAPEPLKSDAYFSFWGMQNSNGASIEVQDIRLVPSGKITPSIKVVGYYVQARNSISIVGQHWEGPKRGSLGLPNGENQNFVTATDLQAAENVIIKSGQDFRAAVVIRGDEAGVMNWNGMDITYRDVGHSAARTMFDPLPLQFDSTANIRTGCIQPS